MNYLRSLFAQLPHSLTSAHVAFGLNSRRLLAALANHFQTYQTVKIVRPAVYSLHLLTIYVYPQYTSLVVKAVLFSEALPLCSWLKRKICPDSFFELEIKLLSQLTFNQISLVYYHQLVKHLDQAMGCSYAPITTFLTIYQVYGWLQITVYLMIAGFNHFYGEIVRTYLRNFSRGVAAVTYSSNILYQEQIGPLSLTIFPQTLRLITLERYQELSQLIERILTAQITANLSPSEQLNHHSTARLTPEHLNQKLPLYSPAHPCSTTHYGQEQCQICLETYQEDKQLYRVLACRHSFHQHCIDQWLLSGHQRCPICRQAAW